MDFIIILIWKYAIYTAMALAVGAVLGYFLDGEE